MLFGPLFESRNANIIFALSCFTLILWSGPSRFLPGYSDSLPTAQTRQGVARGERWQTRDGRYYSVFRGIPYAKQPVQERRFIVPEELDEEDTWDGIVDFNRDVPKCYQTDMMLGGFDVGREDCLQLNIYSPDLKPDSPLPVMVWIHGGGFVIGSGSSVLQGPGFLMDHDVVVVSINYRLGIFGFLSLETEDAPGNLGLWDQRMALVWVRKNIAYFGGDPNKVTIFGESAGSMSVNFHLLSPQSRGLFHQAIMQSGTAISSYTNLNKSPSHYSRSVAEKLGCGKSDNVLKCLQDVPAKTLHGHLFDFDQCAINRNIGLTFPGPWIPIVDKFSSNPFLPESPEILLRKNKVNNVPVMLGFTSEDGLLKTSRFVQDKSFAEHFGNNWNTCAPINILGKEIENITNTDVKYVNNIIEKYRDATGREDIEMTAVFTDALFGLSTHKVSQYLVKGGNKSVFKYYFSYIGTTSFADIMMLPVWKIPLYFISRLLRVSSLFPSLKSGACHADDLLYLFQLTPIIDMIPDAEDQFISRTMVAMWTQFARSGNPTIDPGPVWTPAHQAANEYEYFVIDKSMKMQTVSQLERFKIWN